MKIIIKAWYLVIAHIRNAKYASDYKASSNDWTKTKLLPLVHFFIICQTIDLASNKNSCFLKKEYSII